MDYLELRSAREIMKRVAAHDGALSWHGIVTFVDQRGVELVPPTFYVLRELAKLGYLQEDRPGNRSDAKYLLTESGRELLLRYAREDATEQE